MKKILYVTPHLSTGGLPQYLCKKIESFLSEYEIWCIEYSNISDEYVVQKNNIKNLIGDRLITLSDDKNQILKCIETITPDIIHFEEYPEEFISDSLLDKIYDTDRQYNIVVTTHSSNTNPAGMRYLADKFILVSEWSQNIFKSFFNNSIPCEIWEYPIEIKNNIDKDHFKDKLGLDKEYIHILNIGLFTSGKNQGEIFNLAKKLLNYNVKFHFVGNLAPNFESYWGPLMQSKPDNCIVHGEKSNVNDFYSACDAFYFSSNFELNPLVLKEALSYNLPVFAKKLHTYLNTYDGKVNYITGDIKNDSSILLDNLNISKKVKAFHLLVDVNSDRESISIDSMSQISDKIDYTKCINERYVGDDWRNQTPLSGWANHGPGHWGAFTSFKKAILENFTDDLFGILLFEADCVLDVGVDEFIDNVNKAIEFCKKHELPLFSFGPRYLDDVEQSPIIEEDSEFSDFIITNKFIQAHCILLTKYMKSYLFEQLETNWDSPDIFFNEIYLNINQKIGILRNPISHQEEGLSMIDNVVKGTKSRPISINKRGVDFKFSPNTRNKEFYENVFLNWEEETYDFFQSFTDKNGTCIDIGAWVGLTTIWLSKNFKKVISIEADKDSVKELKENIKLSNCDNVVVCEKAISNIDGKVYFGGQNGINNDSVSRIKENVSDFDYEVDSIKFTSFLKEYSTDLDNVKLIKCDIEGGEENIIEDLLSFVYEKNIPLYLSFHIQWFNDRNLDRFSKVFNLFRGRIYHDGNKVDDVVEYLYRNPWCSLSFIPEKVVLIFSTGRRLSYFEKTIKSLMSNNPDLDKRVKKVWILDDRSSLADRNSMEIIIRDFFDDNYNMINFNSENKFDFIDKFNFIKKITEKDDILLFIEDDWECVGHLDIESKSNLLRNSEITQISFTDPMWIQTDDIKLKNENNPEYWSNPYPENFRHPFKWGDGYCNWSEVHINNYTNNPSIIKAEIFHNNNFEYIKNFEYDFAEKSNGKQLFTKNEIFRHIGEESLINKL